MSLVEIWNTSGSLAFNRHGWMKFIYAASAGGWVRRGVRTWDDNGNLTNDRSNDYLCVCIGGVVDSADSGEMAKGLQRYLDERLSMTAYYNCEDLDDAERCDARERIIPFLRSDGFSVIA